MIRRFLTRILLVVLIAGCAYNWMQTQRLQAQVAALEIRAAQPKHVTVTTRTPEPPESLYSLHSLYSLQGQWKRLRNRAGVVRSTSKKVLSYVKL